MIKFLLFLNFIGFLSVLGYQIYETLRRKRAEDVIFREVTGSLNLTKEEINKERRILDAMSFLYKRSEFHRRLIDETMKRIDEQERHFASFGKFISVLGAEIKKAPSAFKTTFKTSRHD